MFFVHYYYSGVIVVSGGSPETRSFVPSLVATVRNPGSGYSRWLRTTVWTRTEAVLRTLKRTKRLWYGGRNYKYSFKLYSFINISFLQIQHTPHQDGFDPKSL